MYLRHISLSKLVYFVEHGLGWKLGKKFLWVEVSIVVVNINLSAYIHNIQLLNFVNMDIT